MLSLLAAHLRVLVHRLASASRRDGEDDTGALNTLESVILAVGAVTAAALFVAAVKVIVAGDLALLK